MSALLIKPYRTSKDRCLVSDILPWEQALCPRGDLTTGFSEDEVIFFDPNGIKHGEFGIPQVTTSQDYPLSEGERLISAENSTHGTITAVCRELSGPNGWTRCQMRRPIIEGVDLYWKTYSPAKTVVENLLHAETLARTICLNTFDLPACTANRSKSP